MKIFIPGAMAQAPSGVKKVVVETSLQVKTNAKTVSKPQIVKEQSYKVFNGEYFHKVKYLLSTDKECLILVLESEVDYGEFKMFEDIGVEIIDKNCSTATIPEKVMLTDSNLNWKVTMHFNCGFYHWGIVEEFLGVLF